MNESLNQNHCSLSHNNPKLSTTIPAEFPNETGSTLADSFWKVNLINSTDGRSENLQWVRAAEWTPEEQENTTSCHFCFICIGGSETLVVSVDLPTT